MCSTLSTTWDIQSPYAQERTEPWCEICIWHHVCWSLSRWVIINSFCSLLVSKWSLFDLWSVYVYRLDNCYRKVLELILWQSVNVSHLNSLSTVWMDSWIKCEVWQCLSKTSLDVSLNCCIYFHRQYRLIELLWCGICTVEMQVVTVLWWCNGYGIG